MLSYGNPPRTSLASHICICNQVISCILNLIPNMCCIEVFKVSILVILILYSKVWTTYINNCNPYPSSCSRYSCTLEPIQVLMTVLRKGSTLKVQCFHSSCDAPLLVSSFLQVIITIINLAMFIGHSIDHGSISHNKFLYCLKLCTSLIIWISSFFGFALNYH